MGEAWRLFRDTVGEWYQDRAQRLRAALGDPETYILEGDHDTAALCFGFILRRSERFLLEGR
jgi:hypothetical protein